MRIKKIDEIMVKEKENEITPFSGKNFLKKIKDEMHEGDFLPYIAIGNEKNPEMPTPNFFLKASGEDAVNIQEDKCELVMCGCVETLRKTEGAKYTKRLYPSSADFSKAADEAEKGEGGWAAGLSILLGFFTLVGTVVLTKMELFGAGRDLGAKLFADGSLEDGKKTRILCEDFSDLEVTSKRGFTYLAPWKLEGKHFKNLEMTAKDLEKVKAAFKAQKDVLLQSPFALKKQS